MKHICDLLILKLVFLKGKYSIIRMFGYTSINKYYLIVIINLKYYFI